MAKRKTTHLGSMRADQEAVEYARKKAAEREESGVRTSISSMLNSLLIKGMEADKKERGEDEPTQEQPKPERRKRTRTKSA